MLAKYPERDGRDPSQGQVLQPIPKAAWFAIATVVFLTLNYAMIFSFIERMGAAQGFAPQLVAGVLLPSASCLS